MAYNSMTIQKNSYNNLLKTERRVAYQIFSVNDTVLLRRDTTNE